MSKFQLSQLWLLLLLLVFTPPIKAQKQHYRFDNIPPEKGLNNRWVIKVLQGSEGYIWVATQYGLFRFDGYEFKRFVHDQNDETSLAGNYIQNLFKDSKGNLWVNMSPDGGLALYHPEKENFTNFTHDPVNINSLSSNSVVAMDEDNNGVLWIATRNGLNSFNQNTNTFERFIHDPENDNSLADNSLYSVKVNKEGNIWIGTRSKGLDHYNPITKTFTHYQSDPSNPKSLSHNSVYDLAESESGELWLATRGGGLNYLSPNSRDFVRYRFDQTNPKSLSSDMVFSVHVDNENVLWAGTLNSGLNRFNKSTGQFDRYQYNADDPNSLADNDVFSITQDQSGLIWIGTFGGGLTKFAPYAQDLGLMLSEPDNINSIASNEVQAIYKDNSGIIWIGTNQGLDRFDPVKREFTHHTHNPDNPKTISSNDVTAIFEDSVGNLWVGTINAGLNKVLDKYSKVIEFARYTNSENKENSLSDNTILAINQDGQDNLWIGTQNGLNRFLPETNEFIRYMHSTDDGSISSNIIYALYVDHDGDLWVGTGGGGLNHFIKESKLFRHFKHDNDLKNSISNNSIYSIAQDSKGVYWIATGTGLNRFDEKANLFETYSESKGLSKEKLHAVLVDNSDRLWLAYVEKGISLFDSNSGKVIRNVGGNSNCRGAAQGAYYKSEDEELFFGGEGYCAFYPDVRFDNSMPPKIVFTNFRLFNKEIAPNEPLAPPILTNTINFTERVTLNSTQNVFTFNFSALHFSDPDENRYLYKMEGFNADWIETESNNRRATFTNLSPGDYTFRVKASNDQGLWTTHDKTIEITVLPPIWKTWWAYAIYVTCVLGCLGLYVRAQNKKILYERTVNTKLIEKQIKINDKNRQLLETQGELQSLTEELEKRVQDRTRALKQSNEHLRNTQSQLVESEKMAALGSVVVGVSHEINTPVGIAITALSSLQSKTEALFHTIYQGSIKRKDLDTFKQTSDESLNLALSNVNKASNLVTHFKQIAVDRSVENLETINLKTLLQETIDTTLFQENITDSQVCIEGPESLFISTYSGSLVQIFSQLVHNTVNHGYNNKSKVEISVNISETEQEVLIQYRDEGCGIKSGVLSQIFDPFYTTTRGTGTGLGLHVVYNQISHLFNGNIKCISQEGNGCLFILNFKKNIMPDD